MIGLDYTFSNTDKIERINHTGGRWYSIENLNKKFPSVTTILSNTGPPDNGLIKWREKIGNEQADLISKNATDRGTVMHRLLEIYFNQNYLLSSDKRYALSLELSKNDKEINEYDARAIGVGTYLYIKMYQSSILNRVLKSLMQEQYLWYQLKGLMGWAGTVDNVSLMNYGNELKIIDFKTATKPKDEKYIENYKMQVAAYAAAIYQRYGISVSGAEIWISPEQGNPQIFKLNDNDLKEYLIIFINRVKEFYDKFNI